jgi:hypothetical protein
VNTASAITRGFINAKKFGRRAARLGGGANHRRGKAIAVVFIADFLN